MEGIRQVSDITHVAKGDTFICASDGQTYIKQSDRTMRKPCGKCGHKDGLYWAAKQDTGKYHIVNRDGYLHIDTCTGRHKSVQQEPDTADTNNNQEESPVTSLAVSKDPWAVPEPPAPKPAASPVPADAKVAALMELLATPNVTPEQVQGMVDQAMSQAGRDLLQAAAKAVADKVASLSVPTVIKVVRPDGDVKTITGAHKILPRLLARVQRRRHVLLVGPSGTGKSTVASQVADALGLEFYAKSVGPQTSESSIMGYMNASGDYILSLARQAYEYGGVFLFDEFDAGHPGVLTIVNMMLSNGHCAFPDRMVERHPDFIVIAAANTFGTGPNRMFVGRQTLDFATRNRFSVLEMDVDESVENAMVYATGIDPAMGDKVLGYIRSLRKSARDQSMAVDFTPRNAEMLAEALADGIDTVPQAIESSVRQGMSDADWSKVSARATAPTF